MTESHDVDHRNPSRKRLLGKIALGVGLCLISFVIIFGMLASLVSAESGSTDLILMYDTLAPPLLVFGFLFMVSGLLAIILPAGMSKDGTWSLQTGPYR